MPNKPKARRATYRGTTPSEHERWECDNGDLVFISVRDSVPNKRYGYRAWIVYTSFGSMGSWYTVRPFKRPSKVVRPPFYPYGR